MIAIACALAHSPFRLRLRLRLRVQNDAWKHVLVDDRFLCSTSRYRTDRSSTVWAGAPDPAAGKYFVPLCATSASQNEFWILLVEKAFAALHGSYSDIEGGSSVEALSCFVPHSGAGFTMELTTQQQQTAAAAADAATRDVWRTMESCVARAWPMAASSVAPGNAAAWRPATHGRTADKIDGIVTLHAYSVLRCCSAHINGRDTHLVQLRNPWGEGEWAGAFSDSDEASWSPSLRSSTGYDPAGDDGVFWMGLPDFLSHFSRLSVLRRIRLVNEEPEGGTWRKVTARGKWSRAHAIGKTYTAPELCRSPQFVLRVSSE